MGFGFIGFHGPVLVLKQVVMVARRTFDHS